MQHTKDNLGLREYIAIVLLTIGSKVADDTPSIFYDQLYNAAWMAPIISGMLSIVPVLFLIRVMALYKENLIFVIKHLLGKYIGVFVLFILWIIGSAAIIFDSAIYTDILSSMYFTKTPTLVIYAFLIAVCVYGSKKGLESIGSVAWAVLPYIKISLLVALIITMMNGHILYLNPFFGPGEWEVIKESTKKLSIYGDLLYFALLVPYISRSNVYKKGTWIALIILIIEITIGFITYLILFDYESVRLLKYPFHEAIRYIEFGFLTNIETFFLPFWLLATFIRFTVYLYLNAILFGGIFKINNFEYLIPTLATIFVFMGMIPDNPTFTIFNLRNYLLIVTTPLFFFLPCLLWLIAKIKGDFKNEKAKANR